jgi:hypothetical protein
MCSSIVSKVLPLSSSSSSFIPSMNPPQMRSIERPLNLSFSLNSSTSTSVRRLPSFEKIDENLERVDSVRFGFRPKFALICSKVTLGTSLPSLSDFSLSDFSDASDWSLLRRPESDADPRPESHSLLSASDEMLLPPMLPFFLFKLHPESDDVPSEKDPFLSVLYSKRLRYPGSFADSATFVPRPKKFRRTCY